MRTLRFEVCFAVALLTTGVTSAADPKEYEAAIEAAAQEVAQEIGLKPDEISVSSSPMKFSNEDGDLFCRARQYTANLGFQLILRITEELDPCFGPAGRSYIAHTLSTYQNEGAEIQRMPSPFSGTTASWRIGGFRRGVENQKSVVIQYIGLAGTDVVEAYRLYSSHERPQPYDVQRWAEIVAKHTNRLSEPSTEELLKPGEIKIEVDECLDQDGKKRPVVVSISLKDGGSFELYNSAKYKMRAENIRSLTVGGECGATVYRSDGSSFRITPGFKREAEFTWTERWEGVKDTVVHLKNGFVIFFVPQGRGKRGRFEADTKSVNTGVKGTRYGLGHDASTDRSIVGVFEGEVEVTPRFAGARTFTLRAGQQVVITPSEVGPIVPADESAFGGLTGPDPGDPTVAPSIDLSGYWLDDNETCYHVRQSGDELYWFMAGAPRVENVFFGVIAGNVVDGEWADLPGGRFSSNGTLALRIESSARMVKIGQSADYGASTWLRSPSCEPPVYIQPAR